MNIAVIDDSIDEARQLAGFISTYCSDTHTCQQTTIFNTAADFLRCWQRGSFDLIFIDIFLRNETSGIRIAERVRRDDDSCTIVFTTSSTDFALKGYEVRALDYMVKPIRYDKFSQTMEYFLSVSRRKQSHYIEVKESRIMQKIPIDSILTPIIQTTTYKSIFQIRRSALTCGLKIFPVCSLYTPSSYAATGIASSIWTRFFLWRNQSSF